MNISAKNKKKRDELIKYLVASQKELIKECHEDFKTKKFQEIIERLKQKNKILNGI